MLMMIIVKLHSMKMPLKSPNIVSDMFGENANAAGTIEDEGRMPNNDFCFTENN